MTPFSAAVGIDVVDEGARSRDTVLGAGRKDFLVGIGILEEAVPRRRGPLPHQEIFDSPLELCKIEQGTTKSKHKFNNKHHTFHR